MRNPFKKGDIKSFRKTVSKEDLAAFNSPGAQKGSGLVHPFYSTFALARDAEWACRLFAIEMKEEDEEGIGTHIELEHISPALEGMEIIFTATLLEVKKNLVVCRFEAKCGKQLISRGTQKQKILKRAKVDRIFAGLKDN
jgi:predicted thioesterase